MTRARLVILGGLLIVILGLLASGLAGIEFRGGRLPSAPPAPGAPGGVLYLGTPEWFLTALVALIVVVLAASVIALIVSPEARRRLLVWLAVLALVLLVLSLAEDRLRRLIPELEPEPAAVLPVPPEFGAVGEPGAVEPPPPPQVPDWIAVMGGAALAAVIALWVLRRLRSRLPGEEDGIRDAAAAASADLAAGHPVSDVVIRCWMRMVAVLSQRARGANTPAATPRELADHLVRLGFREESVWVLTKLFEEVRYGHKASEPRREEALAALAAIERAG